MKNKDRAEKKIQIAIDKLIDLLSIVPDRISYKVESVLDRVRELENSISNEEENKFKS